MKNIPAALDSVFQRLVVAERTNALPTDTVKLLAVSKGKPLADILTAADCGQRDFAESYLQEAIEKIAACPADYQLCWHFIGAIQSNKTRLLAENFSWIHSVDRLKIAQRLQVARPKTLPPLQICLQVNTSGETSKSGATPAELPELAAAVAKLSNLSLRGLMSIPAPAFDAMQQRAAFASLRTMLHDLQVDFPSMDTLSMGMSADMEVAIAEGATMVRIGTAIFGPR